MLNNPEKKTFTATHFYVHLSCVTAAQDPSMFKLPPHSLDVGTMYEFRVDVTDTAGFSSFATQVRVLLKGVVGRVPWLPKRGTKRLI